MNELFYAFDEDCDDIIDWRDFARALRVFEYPREEASQKLMVSPSPERIAKVHEPFPSTNSIL